MGSADAGHVLLQAGPEMDSERPFPVGLGRRPPPHASSGVSRQDLSRPPSRQTGRLMYITFILYTHEGLRHACSICICLVRSSTIFQPCHSSTLIGTPAPPVCASSLSFLFFLSPTLTPCRSQFHAWPSQPCHSSALTGTPAPPICASFLFFSSLSFSYTDPRPEPQADP